MLLLLLSLLLAWKFVHSKQFSSEISHKLSKLLIDKAGAVASFDQMELGFFPPRAIVSQVSLVKKNELVDIKFKVEKLELIFSVLDLFTQHLNIDEVRFSNGEFYYHSNTESSLTFDDFKKLDLSKIFKVYQLEYSKAPIQIKRISFLNMALILNNLSFKTNELVISPLINNLKAKGEVQSFKISDINIQPIDYLKFGIDFSSSHIFIQSIQAKQAENFLQVSGNLSNDNKLSQIKIDGSGKINLGEVSRELFKQYKIEEYLEGILNIDFKIGGNLAKPRINLKLNVDNLNTNYIQVEKLSLAASMLRNELWVNELKIVNDKELYESQKSFAVYDFSLNRIQNFKTKIKVINAKTNTFLHILHDELESLKATINGFVDVEFANNNLTFSSKEKLNVEKLILKIKGTEKNILDTKNFALQELKFHLKRYTDLSFEGKLFATNTALNFKGELDGSKISVVTKESKIDLDILGPISGVALGGSGPVDLHIHGPWNHVVFDFKTKWDNFNVVDLYFGKIDSSFSLDLQSLELKIANLLGEYNQTKYSGTGSLFFDERSGLDVWLNFSEGHFADLQKMIHLVFKNFEIPFDVQAVAQTNFRVFGGFATDDLKIEGMFKAKKINILGEDADGLGFNLSMSNHIINFKNIFFKKSQGLFSGNASVDLFTNYIEVEGNGSQFKLSDFYRYQALALDLDSEMTFELEGNGVGKNFSSRIDFKTTSPEILETPVSQTSGVIFLSREGVKFKSSVFGGKLDLDGGLNFEKKSFKVKSELKMRDPREFLALLSGVNIFDKTIKSNIVGSFNLDYQYSNHYIQNLDLNIESFNFKRDDVDLYVLPTYNTIKVEQNKVKKWDLKFVDGLHFFNLSGENIGNSIQGHTSFNLKSSLLELISSWVERAKGDVSGSASIVLNNKFKLEKFSLMAKENSFKLKNLTTIFQSAELQIVKSDEHLSIQKAKARLGEGDININGNIYFDGILPLVSLEYELEKTTLPIFKKSSISLSSKGSVTGNRFPYHLVGRVSLFNGEIGDDVVNSVGHEGIGFDELKKFLPVNSVNRKLKPIDLSLQFETINPIIFKNNLAELYLKYFGSVEGDLNSLQVSGKLNVLPQVSKFKFKGHEFLISDGGVDFADRSNIKNSDVKFVALTKINEFDIKLDVSGKIEKINTHLSSEPVKSQEDILSLLTLGVTSEMNKNLEANERTSITRVGIGSIFLDQFKLNEDLNSTIGVNVSVLPEFQEESSSLIQGAKSAVNDSSSYKLKSGTKIKINKRLNNKMDVSASSTVGGSIEQKQEMNFNYKVNKVISFEGVYEIKSAEEEATSTPNSLGADLKFKWSF